ncbi:unnamed protein product [Didymodactylos carnosus]|uniref:EF-hand domain-containing protein n=1 Tax=Didymodactylos carnosus TaxID=1234261 RepID=A0A814R511_9BILA|nr:unnamed protein product [Didymodactylos carnosus]CAF3891876.1 unnamed protein product [Didymodactylos carnosus]
MGNRLEPSIEGKLSPVDAHRLSVAHDIELNRVHRMHQEFLLHSAPDGAMDKYEFRHCYNRYFVPHHHLKVIPHHQNRQADRWFSNLDKDKTGCIRFHQFLVVADILQKNSITKDNLDKLIDYLNTSENKNEITFADGTLILNFLNDFYCVEEEYSTEKLWNNVDQPITKGKLLNFIIKHPNYSIHI